MARPGHQAIQGAVSRNCWAVFSIVPQLGVGGWTPRPRNERMASAMIALGIETVAWTSRALKMFGKDVAQHHPHVAAAQGPRALDVVLLRGAQHQPAGQPNVGRRGRHADGHGGVGQGRSQDGDQADGQDQERKGQPGVREPHDHLIHRAAVIAGHEAGRDAHRDRQEDREDPRLHRGPRSPDHARIDVPPEVIRSEEVSQRRGLADLAPVGPDGIARRQPRRAERHQRNRSTTTAPTTAGGRRRARRQRPPPPGGPRPVVFRACSHGRPVTRTHRPTPSHGCADS